MQGDDEAEDRPKYGYGQEEGYGRKKHVSINNRFSYLVVLFMFMCLCNLAQCVWVESLICTIYVDIYVTFVFLVIYLMC